MRDRSHRGTPASMKKVLSRRSPGPPHGRNRSPARRARTVSHAGMRSASNSARSGARAGPPARGTDEAARGEVRAKLGQRHLARNLPGALAQRIGGRGAHAHPGAAALAAHAPELGGARPAPVEHAAQGALTGRPLSAAAALLRRRRAQDLRRRARRAGARARGRAGRGRRTRSGRVRPGPPAPRSRARPPARGRRAAPRVSHSTAWASQVATRNGSTSWRIRLRHESRIGVRGVITPLNSASHEVRLDQVPARFQQRPDIGAAQGRDAAETARARSVEEPHHHRLRLVVGGVPGGHAIGAEGSPPRAGRPHSGRGAPRPRARPTRRPARAAISRRSTRRECPRRGRGPTRRRRPPPTRGGGHGRHARRAA